MKKQKSSENENTNKGLKTKGGGGGGGGESLDVDEEIFSLVSTVVQWYLVLEEVGPLPLLSPDNNLLFSPLRLPQTAPVSRISSPAEPSVSATKPRKSSRNAPSSRGGWSRWSR